VSTKLNNIAEVLEMLERVELLEEITENPDGEPKNTSSQQNPSPVTIEYDRYRGSGPVRQVQRYIRRNSRRWHNSPGTGNYGGRNYHDEEKRAMNKEPSNRT
jgi:hypothetical protein